MDSNQPHEIAMVRRRAESPYHYGGRDIKAGDVVFMPEGAQRVSLLGKFFYQNHLYEPGDVVELPKGVEGPKRSSGVSNDRIDYGTATEMDANRILGQVKEEPIYVVLEHDDVADDEKDEKPADEPVAMLEPPIMGEDEAKG